MIYPNLHLNNLRNNIMKKTILFALLVLAAFSAGATAQTGDIIYIDGIEWELLDKPLYHNSIIYDKIIKALPKDRGSNTANWDGYTAVWSIKNKHLLLDSVIYTMFNKDTKKYSSHKVAKSTLKNIFKSAGLKPLYASWYNDTMRVAQGKCIYYEHMAFIRNYETELHLKIKNGKVINKTLYHNKILIDGFSINGRFNNDDLIKKHFSVDSNKYPELKGKKVVFSIKDIKVDTEGNIIDYNWVGLNVDKSYAKYQQLKDEIDNMIKTIKPWKTLLINGEVRPEHNFLSLLLNFRENQ